MPQLRLEQEGSYMRQIQIDGIDKAYIIENAVLEQILFNRNLIGLKFTQACENATKAFLLHLEPEISPIYNNIAELMILTKGMYYWMHNAYAMAFNRNLEINFTSTNRIEVSGESARIAVHSSNFDVPVQNLILGDTIASGATICAVLSEYLKFNELKKIFVFTMVGSKQGGQVIAQFCNSHNIDLTLVYGLAAFGLANNGFDLSFLHPDTITSVEYQERARKVFEGKPVSSAGWDFGTQAQAVRKYRMLCWIEAKYWGLEDSSVFQEKEPPLNRRLVEKERAAYEDIYEDIV